MKLDVLAPQIERLAKQAGAAALEIYKDPSLWGVEHKEDESPLTQADVASHNIIAEGLAMLTPNIPIISEEDEVPPYTERKTWQKYWLIDPLDGTKEFINRKGEFTINIALIDNHEAVLGVVYAPVLDVSYCGVKGFGATKTAADSVSKIQVTPLNQDAQTLRLVASRHHGAKAVERLITCIQENIGEPVLTSMGSSLKLCLVAEGKADIYPRLAPTCEWDTAAAQAVVEQAGGVVLDHRFKPLSYNTKASLLNGFFYAIGDNTFDWQGLMRLSLES